MVPHPGRVKEGPKESGSQEVKDKTPGRVGRKEEEKGKACSQEGECTGSSFLRVLRVEILGEILGKTLTEYLAAFQLCRFRVVVSTS